MCKYNTPLSVDIALWGYGDPPWSPFQSAKPRIPQQLNSIEHPPRPPSLFSSSDMEDWHYNVRKPSEEIRMSSEIFRREDPWGETKLRIF